MQDSAKRVHAVQIASKSAKKKKCARNGTKKSREVFVYMHQLIGELRATLSEAGRGFAPSPTEKGRRDPRNFIVLLTRVSVSFEVDVVARLAALENSEPGDKSGTSYASE